MARYTYDLFEPSKDNNVSLDRLTKEFIPLHAEAWHASKREAFKKDYSMNAGAFAGAWFNNTLKIFLAYEGTKPVGYLMGTVFRPMEYAAIVFQVEDWYTKDNPTVRDGLFDYLDGAVRILGCDELWIAYTDERNQKVDLGPGWKEATKTVHYRYIRER